MILLPHEILTDTFALSKRHSAILHAVIDGTHNKDARRVCWNAKDPRLAIRTRRRVYASV